MTQQVQRMVRIETLISSKYFKAGIKDFGRGIWTDYCGINWYKFDAGAIYERGRQYAALMGDNPPTPARYMAARNGGML